jgi:hypothetical protein
VAKNRALVVRDAIPSHRDPARPHDQRARFRLNYCGDYLAFRHYIEPDQVRLHAARFCQIHLLCPFCAIRRGAKALQAYLTRYEAIRAEKTALRPFLVTLTVKDGPDLAERLDHLRRGLRRLNRRRSGKGSGASVWHAIAGAVWSYEVKRGSGSGLWHPHVHAVVLAELEPDQARLAAEWHELTGDSYVVDVRPMAEDVASGFCEVFKYAVKFSDMDPADTVHAWRLLRGVRLMDSCGVFRGVEVPESLLDDPLDGPFIEFLYRFVRGTSPSQKGGYSLVSSG